jgi:hypothetical protein
MEIHNKSHSSRENQAGIRNQAINSIRKSQERQQGRCLFRAFRLK